MPEQRDDRVPVGQPSDDRSLRKGGEVPECGVAAFEERAMTSRARHPPRAAVAANLTRLRSTARWLSFDPPRRAGLGLAFMVCAPCEGRPRRRQMLETFG